MNLLVSVFAFYFVFNQLQLSCVTGTFSSYSGSVNDELKPVKSPKTELESSQPLLMFEMEEEFEKSELGQDGESAGEGLPQASQQSEDIPIKDITPSHSNPLRISPVRRENVLDGETAQDAFLRRSERFAKLVNDISELKLPPGSLQSSRKNGELLSMRRTPGTASGSGVGGTVEHFRVGNPLRSGRQVHLYGPSAARAVASVMAEPMQRMDKIMQISNFSPFDGPNNGKYENGQLVLWLLQNLAWHSYSLDTIRNAEKLILDRFTHEDIIVQSKSGAYDASVSKKKLLFLDLDETIAHTETIPIDHFVSNFEEYDKLREEIQKKNRVVLSHAMFVLQKAPHVYITHFRSGLEELIWTASQHNYDIVIVSNGRNEYLKMISAFLEMYINTFTFPRRRSGGTGDAQQIFKFHTVLGREHRDEQLWGLFSDDVIEQWIQSMAKSFKWIQLYMPSMWSYEGIVVVDDRPELWDTNQQVVSCASYKTQVSFREEAESAHHVEVEVLPQDTLAPEGRKTPPDSSHPRKVVKDDVSTCSTPPVAVVSAPYFLPLCRRDAMTFFIENGLIRQSVVQWMNAQVNRGNCQQFRLPDARAADGNSVRLFLNQLTSWIRLTAVRPHPMSGQMTGPNAMTMCVSMFKVHLGLKLVRHVRSSTDAEPVVILEREIGAGDGVGDSGTVDEGEGEEMATIVDTNSVLLNWAYVAGTADMSSGTDFRV